MNKELKPEIEFCAFNFAIVYFLFCFTAEVIDDYTSIFQ